MNLHQIVNMVVRMLMRRGINWGITKGIGLTARRGKPAQDTRPEEMTPEDRKQAQVARDTAKRARKAARITRRMF